MQSISDVIREIDAALERYRRARVLIAALDEPVTVHGKARPGRSREEQIGSAGTAAGAVRTEDHISAVSPDDYSVSRPER